MTTFFVVIIIPLTKKVVNSFCTDILLNVGIHEGMAIKFKLSMEPAFFLQKDFRTFHYNNNSSYKNITVIVQNDGYINKIVWKV